MDAVKEMEEFEKWYDALTPEQKGWFFNMYRVNKDWVLNYYRRLKRLSEKTNRSFSQTMFLWSLLSGDTAILEILEERIKNCFLYYCPGDMDDINEILEMEPKSSWFSLD